jgi:hypothetical protein
MSHFDDIDDFFWIFTPTGLIGTIFFVLIGGGLLFWAWNEDANSHKLCQEHGEKYVDSRGDYTLCEADGGVVVKR